MCNFNNDTAAFDFYNSFERKTKRVYSVGRHILVNRKAMKEKEGILKKI